MPKENKIVSKEEERHILEDSNLQCQSPSSHVDFCSWCSFMSTSPNIFPDPSGGRCSSQVCMWRAGHSHGLLQLADVLPRALLSSRTLFLLHSTTKMLLNSLLSSGSPELSIELTISPHSEHVKLNGYFAWCHLDYICLSSCCQETFTWLTIQWSILEHFWLFFPSLYSYLW